MSFVKWLRKNNRKVMTFVVIFCMISFVIGYTGIQILGSFFDPNKQSVAHYDSGSKIKINDLKYAQNELTVLRMLMSENLLASQGVSGMLLAHLLFPDSQLSGEIAAQLKQAAQRGQIQVSVEELDAWFNQQPQRPEELWILLKAEAYKAGYILSNANAKEILRSVIPQMMRADASQVVGQIMSKSNLTEDQVVRIFADLITIVGYANEVINNQAVTLNQIRAMLGRSKERLNADFVKITAEPLIDKSAPLSDADIQKQFEAFKQQTPNNPADGNPFGFGYRLPKRVQVEYMILLMDDVKSQIEAPTAEAMEEYYSRNIERFQTSEPVDPNKPEGEKITHTRSYAESESQIRMTLENDKTSKLANMIFNEIRDMTETGFAEISLEEATAEQLQMAAGDYQASARQLSEKYRIPIAAGKTGWLSPDDFRIDKILNGLSMQQQRARIPLSELVFTAVSDPKQKMRRIGLPTIRIWQNIGPVQGGYYSEEKEKYYPMMTMVRVIGIQEPAVPETVDVEYDTHGVVLADVPQPEKSRFSLKEKVQEDLRLQKAMETAKARAEELAALVQSKNWDEAITGYNQKYAAGGEDPNQPNGQAVKLDSVKEQIRISAAEIAQIRQYIAENPIAAGYLQPRLTTNLLNSRLHDLFKDNAPSTGTIQQVLVLEPAAACYVVKEVVRLPATQEDYLQAKANTAMQLSAQDAAQSALIHFSPQNILARMNFERKEIKQRTVVEEELPMEEPY